MENCIALNFINYLQNSNLHLIQVSKPLNFEIGLSSIFSFKKRGKSQKVCRFILAPFWDCLKHKLKKTYFKDINAVNNILNRANFFFFLFHNIFFCLILLKVFQKCLRFCWWKPADFKKAYLCNFVLTFNFPRWQQRHFDIKWCQNRNP